MGVAREIRERKRARRPQQGDNRSIEKEKTEKPENKKKKEKRMYRE